MIPIVQLEFSKICLPHPSTTASLMVLPIFQNFSKWKTWWCTWKLRELAAKIEEALKELEPASEEYESFLELEGLQEYLTLTENAAQKGKYVSRKH